MDLTLNTKNLYIICIKCNKELPFYNIDNNFNLGEVTTSSFGRLSIKECSNCNIKIYWRNESLKINVKRDDLINNKKIFLNYNF
jgi:hypothetical protein